ncbi:TetR/AcrR family transcriptional regulator [Sulfidibacter corallicola]|uniref:TetR/AcrR family transcriptional regulator n=1 Tax=Sulfidibacter corallicola TaxID=2818388 RepID=A0A8A4TWW8_SULCO|nr:TetR/AcrR family transcriptional regulator [Sulfidibacter corallicola]QTD53462.1 TetR/AcrR family transcriptional regulator [Sulfidibacter corallicola]
MERATRTKGHNTRSRILETAARLIHRRGVHATSVDQVLTESGTGKSQFYYHFKTKEALVHAVLEYQVELVMEAQREQLAGLDRWSTIEAWFGGMIEAKRGDDAYLLGCPVGTLAAEMTHHDADLRAKLDDIFTMWRQCLAAGLRRMQERGELKAEADPEALAEFAIAAKQGAFLVTKTRRDISVLVTVLGQVLRHLKSFAVAPEAAESR